MIRGTTIDVIPYNCRLIETLPKQKVQIWCLLPNDEPKTQRHLSGSSAAAKPHCRPYIVPTISSEPHHTLAFGWGFRFYAAKCCAECIELWQALPNELRVQMQWIMYFLAMLRHYAMSQWTTPDGKLLRLMLRLIITSSCSDSRRSFA